MDLSELQKFDQSNFMLIKSLGSGSYRYVQLLYHKKLNQFLVQKSFSFSGSKKIILKQISVTEREAQVLFGFKHKNIVRVLGTTIDEQQSFGIIFEYVPSGDLESLLMLEIDVLLPWKIR